MNLVTETKSVLLAGGILCGSTECSLGNPTGPNGIAIYTDSSSVSWLIVVADPATLLKINTDSGAVTKIASGVNSPSNALSGIDGLVLYNNGPRNSILYATAIFVSQAGVQALTSRDEWSTYDISTVYNASCTGGVDSGDDPALALIGSESIAILCSNLLAWDGTAYITVLENVVGDQISKTVETINLPYMAPESFDYDPNRNMLVFSSFNIGGVYGFPYVDEGNIVDDDSSGSAVSYGSSFAYTYIATGTSGLNTGLGVQLDYVNTCGVYICAGQYPPSPGSQAALYYINICTDSVVSFVNLPAVSSGSLPNDVTILNGIAYVTDTFGNQLWSVVSGNNGVLSNPQVILTGTSCASNDPTFCILAPDGIETVTIGVSTPFLLISLIGYGIVKYIPSTGSLTKVMDATGLMGQFDGIYFSPDQTVLYGTRNSLAGTVYESVMAVTSCDEWASAQIVYTFQLNCGNTNSPALTIVTNQEGGQDLVTLCNDGFGAGPYSIQRVKNVQNVVANGPICANSYSTPSSASTSSTTAPFSSTPGFVAVIYSAVIIFVVVLAAIYYFLVLGNSLSLSESNNSSSKPDIELGSKVKSPVH